MARKRFLEPVVVVLLFGLALARCDGGGGTGTNALVGTWEGDAGFMSVTWSFTGNRFTQSMMGVKQTVLYKVKGNSIITEYQGVEIEMDFKINGDALTVKFMGIPIEFKRVK
jgi:hypothetical protein